MFAFLAALVFFVVLVFEPHSDLNLVVLGFLLISLHLCTPAAIGVWRTRRAP